MSEYCTASDLYSYGLPRGALPNPGRLAASALASTDAFGLDVHGFVVDDPVTLRAEANGLLPTPLVEGTTYYVIPLTDNFFQVAAAPAGAPIDLTADGSRVVVITPLPITSSIIWASSLVEDMIPAHLVPLTEPFPEIIRATTAELAAGKLTQHMGATTKSIGEMVDNAHKRLARWAKGIPLRGENVPPATNKATSAIAPYLDQSGWSEYGGL